MKLILLAAFLVLTNLASAQTLFFDELNNSIWTSSYQNEPTSVFESNGFGLSRLYYSHDSINKNVSIWSFTNDSLTISNYNLQTKSETLIGGYRYETDENARLIIHTNTGGVIKYNVGIVSTGNYVSLARIKNKKSKL